MTTFTTRFLGCKVSFADAQAMRERLLADGHTELDESGEVAVVNTCCVTHEAVSKSRQAVSPAGAHRRRRLRHGMRIEPRGGLRGCRRTSSLCDARRRRGRVRRGRCRRYRMRPGRAPSRSPARLREDPGRLLVFLRLLRDPVVRGGTRSRRPRRALGDPSAGSARDTWRSSSRASTWAASATAKAAIRSHGWCARPAQSRARAPAAVVDRDQPRRRRARRGAARDPDRVTASARSAPVGRRPRPPGNGAPVHR